MTTEERNCLAKTPFASKNACDRAINRQDRGVKLRPYRCQNCGQWHITSVPKDAYKRKDRH